MTWRFSTSEDTRYLVGSECPLGLSAEGKKPFLPTITRYFGPDGRRCDRTAPGAKKVTMRTETYCVQVGKKKISLKTRDYDEAIRRIAAMRGNIVPSAQPG